MKRPKSGTKPAARRDSRIVAALSAWFSFNARDLPWRRVDPATGKRNPYWCLVSEFMLQQTQVARAVEKFVPFITRFPTVRALARADLDDVLAAWSGLGYYRRARNLHAAANQIVTLHGGRIPESVEELRMLPGVGRYTAGAIVSIAMGRTAPIVDGNVLRVLMRLDGVRGSATGKETEQWVWSRAESLTALAGPRIARFNEGLMELGAIICTPAGPRCSACPLLRDCQAAALGLHKSIPPPKKSARERRLLQVCLLVRDRSGRILLEQRPSRGLWAGLWQTPTIEVEWTERKQAYSWLEGVTTEKLFGAKPRRTDVFDRMLSHRKVRFEVWEVPDISDAVLSRYLTSAILGPHVSTPTARRVWRTPVQVETLALSVPQRRILLRPEVRKGMVRNSRMRPLQGC